MMTMLHSVWSGGGSAAGRRRSLLALGALLALVASALVWTASAQAQNTAPPIAIAVEGTGGEGRLDGSSSFDPDGENSKLKFKWEVMTDSYSWLSLEYQTNSLYNTKSDTPTAFAKFNVPSATLAARYGQSIEFKLTVTDEDSASASDTVVVSLNQRPTADIAVTATLLKAGGDKTKAADYTVDAVIDGPGENGNAANEWDIKEGALVVLDGTGSSDPNGRITAHQWTRIHPGTGASGFPGEGSKSKLSSNLPDSADGDIFNMLTASSSPLYVYYRLNVTDRSGETRLR